MAGAGCMVLVQGLKKETDENSNESNEVEDNIHRKNGGYSQLTIREKLKKSANNRGVKNGHVSRINGTTKSMKLSIPVRSRKGRPLNSEETPSKNRRSPRLERQDIIEKHVPSVALMYECSCTKMGRTPVISGTVPSSTVRRSLNCQCVKLSTMNSVDLKDMFLQHSKTVSIIPNHRREDCEQTNGKTYKADNNGKINKPENGKNGLLDTCLKNGFNKLDGFQNGLIHTKNGVYFQHNHRRDANAKKFPTRVVENCTPKHSSTTPAEEDNTMKSQELTLCKWAKCQVELEVDSLPDHIREKHVETQKSKEKVVCLWEGCKVYSKQSSSQSWLERHMLTHSGAKPFKCIVDGCGQRFTSRAVLERHVNGHFNRFVQSSPKAARKEDTPSKQKKKKSKRRKSCIIKVTDYVDSQIMEGLKYQLTQLNSSTHLDTKGSGQNMTFLSTVIGKRTDQSGKSKVLLRWNPADILDDMWVPEEKAQSLRKTIMSLKNLPQSTLARMDPKAYRRHRFRKNKRK